MPRFDGTGPMGMGAMTGRGLGYCAVPIGHYGLGSYDMPYTEFYGYAPRPYGSPSYSPHFYGMGPFVSRPRGFWGVCGFRPWGRGRSFGRGRGLGRRWW